jgi:hypothetical protein
METKSISDVEPPDSKSMGKSNTLSPNAKRRRFNLQLELEKERYQNTWACCGRTTDKRCINFIGRWVVSCAVLSFSLYQLSVAEDCDPLIPLWSGIITFIIGALISARNEKKNAESVPAVVGSPMI